MATLDVALSHGLRDFRLELTLEVAAETVALPQDLTAAQAFVITLLGSEGRAALKAVGFGLPQ